MESRDARLRRLLMRAHRRGTREMDLLLGAFARAHLADLAPADLDLFEALLEEPDDLLLLWATGREAAPPRFAPLLARAVAAHAAGDR